MQDVQAASEREPVHVQPRGASGLERQRANDEVAQRQGVHFLTHAVRRFAAEVRGLFDATRTLVRLLFVEDQFFFPAFVVSQDQFLRRELRLVQQVGEQSMRLAATAASAGTLVESASR